MSGQGMLFETSPDGLVRPKVAMAGGGGGSPPPAPDLNTSRLAYRQARLTAGSAKARIYVAIAASGKVGMTCDEVEQQLNMPHQTVSARIVELRESGWLRRGPTPRITRTKGLAAVYLANPAPESGS